MSAPTEGTRGQTPDDVRRISLPRTFAAGKAVPGLSSWILERRLGGGGFGEVWLAKHALDKERQPRAVKFCTDPEARHRLVTHEKNVVVRVMKYAPRHPNIVPLLDYNLDGDVPWLMYEFVEGGTLASLIEQWHELPLSNRLGRTVQALHAIAGALTTCHRLYPPLIHRDMKPHNVLMADGKVPRITDFGIGGVAVQKDGATSAALTACAAGVPSALRAAGTAVYASPEQLRGSLPNPRDDVFALGVIAYQAIIGKLERLAYDVASALGPLHVPRDLITLVAKSLELDPLQRPADAREWKATLAAVIEKAQQQPGGTVTGTKAVSTPRPATATRPRAGADRSAVQPPLPSTTRLSEPSGVAGRVRSPSFKTKVLGAALVLAAIGAATAVVREISRPRTPSTEQEARPNGNPSFSAAPQPGETRSVEMAPGVVMAFCWVPAGECRLGSPHNEQDYLTKALFEGKRPNWLDAEAEARHRRMSTSGFWMGKYEVTQSEWAAVMKGTALEAPSFFRPEGTDASRLPVESVSWNDCTEFLKRASAHNGVQQAFGRSGTFRLPHEEEWEYACRGGLGNTRPFYFGDVLNGTEANCNGDKPYGTVTQGENWQGTIQVGSYAARFPHPWGLCDMHGNVWEWCDNRYTPPTGPGTLAEGHKLTRLLEDTEVEFARGSVPPDQLPLFELLNLLSTQHKVTFVFMTDELQADGLGDIREEKPKLTATRIQGMKLGNFLDLLLRPLNATYVVRSDRIEITTARRRLEEHQARAPDNNLRVLRGGSWGSPPHSCRSASRNWAAPADRYDHCGFRVCIHFD
ncbi:MAG: SUMF1/EgtB/PvdO family nonheme iron enzyme [Planctomycetes bacterium]|nr:SUMF1/EgtB/PvdO family nonheme iron enzyme [Planctomycetota bacterium]